MESVPVVENGVDSQINKGQKAMGKADGEHNSVTVLLGSQWGDEGKGKLIDYFISQKEADITARCQGGNNAGHTVVVRGKSYDFHLLPSGIIHAQCQAIIGNGVVVNLDSMFKELQTNGVLAMENWQNRLLISEKAHLVFNVHALVDELQEADRETNKKKIGTTKRGIGPTYSSKCFRNGIRIADLMGDFERFREKFYNLVAHYKKVFPKLDKMDFEEELAQLKNRAEDLKRLNIVGDTVSYLHEARENGRKILVEGANGALLDIDFGTYPYVTSSNCTAGGACTGLGIPPQAISRVIGVVKAYQTRVGSGPFPTELQNETGEKLQNIGKEWGVTTGRRRRCGWLDLVLLRRAHQINFFQALALTKLDILDDFAEIQVAVAYRLDGEILKSPPARNFDWDRVEVVYETLPGWQYDISNVRDYANLPVHCKNYVQFIENFVRVPVRWIGVGQDREALIVIKSYFGSQSRHPQTQL